MILPVVILYSVLVVSVSCDTDFDKIYDEFVNKVVNIKEVEKLIRDTLPSDVIDVENVILQFLDPWTKFASGIIGGNFFDLGHFDECYKIQVQDVYGKYCLGTLPLTLATKKYFQAFQLNTTQRQPRFQVHPQPRLLQFGPEYTGFHWAACVPHTMAASDIPGLFTYTEDFCYSKNTEPKLTAGAIGTICVLTIFLALATVSTIFDVYLFYAEKKPPHELFIAFSFLTNGRKIFKSTNNSDQLLCLNGIKAISMMWVILGHEYSNAMNAPLYNFLDIQGWENDPANMFMMGATVSVDTFFVVGGLVTVYTFLKAMDKGVKFNVILFYVHRYLRLTPALAIVALVYMYLLNYLGNGPLWITVDWTLSESCQKGWWSTFLYVTNYVQDGICLPQAWYLSVDMQLYILSPIILIPLYKWPKPTLGALGFLAIAGCIIPFAIAYSKNMGTMLSVTADTNVFMNDYYIQTYTRFGPYVIGMALGYFLYKIKKNELKITMSKLLAWSLWLFSLTGLVATVYAGYPLNVATEPDRWGNSMFTAFDRPAWSLALCGVIFLCVSGYGHPIDQFLSLPIFQFLTKLSYSMYLVHFAVITVRYAAMKNTIKFSNIATLHVFWADFMVTLGLGLVVSLLFESPIIILEKYLFGRGGSKQTRNDKNEQKPEV